MARVLIADDSVEQVEMWKLLLERAGHEVAVAISRSEAIAQLQQFNPRVVVLDLNLPNAVDGRALLLETRRSYPDTRVVLVSGWPEGFDDSSVDQVLLKPIRVEVMLATIARLACLILLCAAVCTPAFGRVFPFQTAVPAEVVATLEMSSPGSDWGAKGREAAVARIAVDGGSVQHVVLYAGGRAHPYGIFLGALKAGKHELHVERQSRHSAPGSGFEIHSASFHEIKPEDAGYDLIAHAPVLFARADTIGRFSDVPVLAYGERLIEDGEPTLQYTVVFSNEDGGTSTRALMARWGRTTDIEYVYRYRPGSGRASVQGPDHKEVEFTGKRDGSHPLLIPVTSNNMVSGEGTSALRFQLAPAIVDLSRASREQIMDDYPVAYSVMARELLREGKLRTFGMVDGEKISDPRNYLYCEANIHNRQGALGVLVRLDGETLWRSSHLGRVDYAISRSGWVRTAVELPPGTRREQIAEIGFECLVATQEPLPVSGVCEVRQLSRMFLLGPGYDPGNSFAPPIRALEIPSGQVQARVCEPCRSPR